MFLGLANLRLNPAPKAIAVPAPRIVKGSGTTFMGSTKRKLWHGLNQGYNIKMTLAAWNNLA